MEDHRRPSGARVRRQKRPVRFYIYRARLAFNGRGGAPVARSALSLEQQSPFAIAAETNGGEYTPDGSEEFYDLLTELFLSIYKRDAEDNLLCRSEDPFPYEWKEFRAIQGSFI